jgi:hypothetical protein
MRTISSFIGIIIYGPLITVRSIYVTFSESYFEFFMKFIKSLGMEVTFTDCYFIII